MTNLRERSAAKSIGAGQGAVPWSSARDFVSYPVRHLLVHQAAVVDDFAVHGETAVSDGMADSLLRFSFVVPASGCFQYYKTVFFHIVYDLAFQSGKAFADQRCLHIFCRKCGQMELFKFVHFLSLIHISEPTRLGMISYAVFCLKKKKKTKK